MAPIESHSTVESHNDSCERLAVIPLNTIELAFSEYVELGCDVWRPLASGVEPVEHHSSGRLAVDVLFVRIVSEI